jgi:hypothetical protein
VLWGSELAAGGACHIVHAYDLAYVERMQLRGVSDAVVDARIRRAHEDAMTTVHEARRAAANTAGVQVHAVRGEPVTVLLAEIARHAPEVVVLGKRHSQAPSVQAGAIGGVALRIAYQSPVDVLLLS